MNPSNFLRILVGGVLVSAAIAKWMVGAAPLVAATIDLMNLSDARWSQVERAWQAISFFEFVLGIVMVFSVRRERWNLALGAAMAAFLAWDVARWATGGPPDCGCFGGFSIASEWWHVAAKHLVLWCVVLVLTLTPNSPRQAQASMKSMATG